MPLPLAVRCALRGGSFDCALHVVGDLSRVHGSAKHNDTSCWQAADVLLL